jgi:hypothetical protein
MSRLTVGKKLGLGVTALGVFLLVLSYTSLRAISNLGSALDSAVNNTAKKLELVGSTQAVFQELKHASLREQIAFTIRKLDKHRGTQSSSSTAATCSLCHAPADENLRALEAGERNVRKETGELRSLVSDEASQKAVAAIEDGVSKWVEDGRQYLARRIPISSRRPTPFYENGCCP